MAGIAALTARHFFAEALAGLVSDLVSALATGLSALAVDVTGFDESESFFAACL